MKKDLSRVSDIKLSSFLNVSWLIILTKLRQSIRRFSGKALSNQNVVFADWLLIVKWCSSSEELSLCNKLALNFWGFDWQTAENVLLYYIFDKFFPFAILHLLAKWVELPQRKLQLLERKPYLSCVTFNLAIPSCISYGSIIIDCFSAISMAWTFLARPWLSYQGLANVTNSFGHLTQHIVIVMLSFANHCLYQMHSRKIPNFASIFFIIKPNYFHHGYRNLQLD